MSTTTLPTKHITTAVRALLDHIDAYDLPFPAEITGPDFRYPDHLVVYVMNHGDSERWLARFCVDEETSDVRGSSVDGRPYIRTLAVGRLPDTGIQAVLYLKRDVPLQLVTTTPDRDGEWS